MSYVYATNRLTVEEATTVFTGLNIKQLRQRMPWTMPNYRTEHNALVHLRNLVSGMYRNGYELVSGQWELRLGIGRAEAPREVYLWTRQLADGERDFWADDIQVGLNDELVPVEDPVPLIPQAMALTKAYKQGYEARSREVRDSLSNLLGVPGNAMTTLTRLSDEED